MDLCILIVKFNKLKYVKRKRKIEEDFEGF